MLGLSRCILASSHKASTVMTEFNHLVEKKGLNLNQLQWRQFFNWVDGKVLESLNATQVCSIVQCLSKYPNQDRFHELMNRFGERIDRVSDGVDPSTALLIVRSYVEAGLHVVNPETRRYKKQQVSDAQQRARDLVPHLLERALESPDVDPIEKAYVGAMCLQQGFIDRSEMSFDTVIANGLEATRSFDDLSVGTRAEFAWALSRLCTENTLKGEISKLYTLKDVQLFEYYKNMVSMPLMPRKEWFRSVQILDATGSEGSRIAETVFESLRDKSTVCGTMAAHALWWRAISGGQFDSVSAKCMQVCMDKVDSMSDVDKWKARCSLVYFGSKPVTDRSFARQLQYCNRNDIIGRPKRAAVAWRHVGSSRISYSVHS